MIETVIAVVLAFVLGVMLGVTGMISTIFCLSDIY